MKNFKKLLIWQEGMAIVNKVYELVRHLPEEERFGLRVQMTKSAVSIPSNVAEGSAKRSQKDYARFIEISLASAFELETQILIVENQGWSTNSMTSELLKMLEKEQRMLSKFLNAL